MYICESMQSRLFSWITLWDWSCRRFNDVNYTEEVPPRITNLRLCDRGYLRMYSARLTAYVCQRFSQ